LSAFFLKNYIQLKVLVSIENKEIMLIDIIETDIETVHIHGIFPSLSLFSHMIDDS
tara:strand:+ start:370 stop:537 length:168 start_codon:yes stop_codon:yes gene_type:complete